MPSAPELVKNTMSRGVGMRFFNSSASNPQSSGHFIKRFNYTNNLIGSVNLINAAVNVGTVHCFVFTSSIAVYGPNQVPMVEELTPQPEDPYGIAKHAVLASPLLEPQLAPFQLVAQVAHLIHAASRARGSIRGWEIS